MCCAAMKELGTIHRERVLFVPIFAYKFVHRLSEGYVVAVTLWTPTLGEISPLRYTNKHSYEETKN
jgi:hypothetical protein